MSALGRHIPWASVSPAVKGGDHLSDLFWPGLSEAVEGLLGSGGKTRDTPGMAAVTPPRFCPHRLSLNKSRLLTRAAKGFLGKPLTKTPDSAQGNQSSDYIPLVSALDPRPQPHTQQRGHTGAVCVCFSIHLKKKKGLEMSHQKVKRTPWGRVLCLASGSADTPACRAG